MSLSHSQKSSGMTKKSNELADNILDAIYAEINCVFCTKHGEARKAAIAVIGTLVDSGLFEEQKQLLSDILNELQ